MFLNAFDLLELNSEDYRQYRLEQRKGKLEKLLARTRGMRSSEHLDGDSQTIFKHACKMGLEGIVSKRRDFPYRSGRTKGWIKVHESCFTGNAPNSGWGLVAAKIQPGAA